MPRGTLQERAKKSLERYRKERLTPKRRRGRPPKETGGGKASIPQPVQEHKTSPPKPKDTRLPKEVLGIDTAKFLRLIKKRTNDPLHILVDIAQATSALRMFNVLEKCDTVEIFTLEPDEKVKLLNAIKGANASANDTLKSLNITASTREEVNLTDKSLERLAKEDIDLNIPPSLQSEYLLAQEDMKKMSGEHDDVLQAEQQELVDEIKKPVDISTKVEEAREDTNLIDLDVVGIQGGLS